MHAQNSSKHPQRVTLPSMVCAESRATALRDRPLTSASKLKVVRPRGIVKVTYSPPASKQAQSSIASPAGESSFTAKLPSDSSLATSPDTPDAVPLRRSASDAWKMIVVPQATTPPCVPPGVPPQHSPQPPHTHNWATHSTIPGHPASYTHGAWAHQYPLAYPYAHAPLPTPGLAQPVQSMPQYLPSATGYQAYPYQPVTTPVASAGFDYHSLPAHHQNFILTVATACWKDQYAVLEQKNKQLEARLAVEKQRYEAVALKVNRLKAAAARGGNSAAVGVVSDNPADHVHDASV